MLGFNVPSCNLHVLGWFRRMHSIACNAQSALCAPWPCCSEIGSQWTDLVSNLGRTLERYHAHMFQVSFGASVDAARRVHCGHGGSGGKAGCKVAALPDSITPFADQVHWQAWPIRRIKQVCTGHAPLFSSRHPCGLNFEPGCTPPRRCSAGHQMSRETSLYGCSCSVWCNLHAQLPMHWAGFNKIFSRATHPSLLVYGNTLEDQGVIVWHVMHPGRSSSMEMLSCPGKTCVLHIARGSRLFGEMPVGMRFSWTHPMHRIDRPTG